MRTALALAAATFMTGWGIAHMFPTRGIVSGFGDIGTENRRVITMEWIFEGVTLIFAGTLTAAVSLVGDDNSTTATVAFTATAALPLGTDLVDKDGKNVLETSRPKEFDDLTTLLHPRGEQVFFGAYDPDAPPAGLGERFVRHVPAARDALPAGDFRDWPAIDTWAAQIAAELGAGEPRTQ